MPRSVIIGSAGHIDHGKTALVRALTGIDTDRLPEEKRRGITVDLGFAVLEAEAQDGSALRLSLIDVPGHARFVGNMLAGAGGIDAVLMVISAEEGVMPQTEEHLAICSLLGIECGVVALTKTDLVSEEQLHATRSAVQSFLKDTFLRSAPIVSVSAHSALGIAELRRELIRLAASAPPRKDDTVLRLPIDRAFVIQGFGTVVTGTVIGGSVRAGDELTVLPGDRIVRVRGIQSHGRGEPEAGAGSRAALNLTRIEAAELRRGDTLVRPSSLQAVDVVDITLHVLRDAVALKHRARVHFHAFASECMAVVTLYERTSVEPGETRLARLRLSQPVVLLPDDRFVVRMGTPITTIGGGLVLDAHPVLRVAKAKTAEWLGKLRAASPEERVWLRIVRRGVGGSSVLELSCETGIAEAALREVLRRWIREGRIRAAGPNCMLTEGAFVQARETIVKAVRAHSDGSTGGVRRAELRERAGLGPEVFDDALNSLAQEGQLQVAGEFVLPAVATTRSSQDHARLSAIAGEYERAGVTPSAPAEVGMRLGIAPAEMRRLMTLLLRDGTLVRLNDDALCMHYRALQELTEQIKGLRGQTLDIATFKRVAGVSRKFAIPLLEYLDRERITLRKGSDRLVR